MSIENPTTILIDVNGSPLGTPTNVLFVSGSSTVTGSVQVTNTVPVITVGVTAVTGSVSISGLTTVTANIGTTGGLALDTSVQSINAKLGNLGQQTMAGSAPVVIASDQAPIPVTGSLTSVQAKSSTASTFSISASLSPTQLLAGNPSRLGGIFVNDSPASAFLRFGAGATPQNWTYRMFPYASIELNEPIFDGVVSATWLIATGSMHVTEMT